MKLLKRTAIMVGGVLLPWAFATANETDPDYLRSSLYTILVNSDSQNARIEKENNEVAGNEFMEMAKGLAKTDAKKAANDTSSVSLSQLPMIEFLKIAIPAQFNDHNLGVRVIDFDALREGISADDASKANEEATGKKKSKFGAFAKAAAGIALSAAAGTDVNLINTDDTGDYMIAVVNKHIAADNTAAKMMARWFDYSDAADAHWNPEMPTLTERAIQSLNIVEQGSDNKALAAQTKMYNLIPNTFLLTVNLQLRSNKAIVAESQKLAGGLLGKDSAKLLGAGAAAAAGDGYSVQAMTTLYRLVWGEEQELAISEALEGNKTLDELIATGVFKLECVGKDKASARVRQSLFSNKPISDLVARASTRAIDAAIVKLQNKNEVFRTKFPISGCDDEGNIRVKIGTREGVSKGDVYAILEPQADEQGRVTGYKEIATVKPNEKLIWNNLAGAEDEAAENAGKSEGNDDEFDNDAVKFGYTTFIGKKGKDYTNYLIQLKKKK